MGVLTMNGEQEARGGMDDKNDARPTVLVVEEVNGNQAVESAATESPDIILMDLSLPQLDGLAATRRIRSQEGPRKVPIVAVSAHDSADFHAEALAAGCNEYVTKPIAFDQLVQLLDRLTAK